MTNYNFDSKFIAKSEFLSDAKFSGGLSLESSAKVREIYEKVCVYTTSSYSSLEIDVNQGSLHHYTAEAGSNFTVNLKNLKDAPAQTSIVVTLLLTMGSSAYVMSDPSTTGFKIDDKAVVVKWINSTPPTSGFTNAVNVYTFAVVKTTATDYTVLGTLSSFG